jgi:hypothetical protein
MITSYRNISFLSISFCLVILAGCNATAREAGELDLQPAAIVDASSLAGKTPKELDALFGAPVKVSPVNVEALMPGEDRVYQAEGGKVVVRTYRGAASHVVVEFEQPSAASDEQILAMVGLNMDSLKLSVEGTAAPLWENKDLGLSSVVLLPHLDGGNAGVGIWYEGYPEL